MRFPIIPTICSIGFAILRTEPAAMDGKISLFHANREGYRYASADSAAVKYPAGDYFAVICADSGCVLEPAKVAHKKEKVLGYDLNDPNGDVIRVGKYAKSLFLIRGLPGLAPGALRTIYFNRRFQDSILTADPDSSRSASKTLMWDGQETMIYGAWAGGQRGDPDESADFLWKIKSPTYARTIAKIEFTPPLSDEAALGIGSFLLWAGDIDGDGKADFLVRPQARLDYLEMSLFLSGQIKAGSPWRAAARFYWWDPSNPGC
jgi:hypothetical protein